jgi:hypothetical protein
MPTAGANERHSANTSVCSREVTRDGEEETGVEGDISNKYVYKLRIQSPQARLSYLSLLLPVKPQNSLFQSQIHSPNTKNICPVFLGITPITIQQIIYV